MMKCERPSTGEDVFDGYTGQGHSSDTFPPQPMPHFTVCICVCVQYVCDIPLNPIMVGPIMCFGADSDILCKILYTLNVTIQEATQHKV